MSGMFSERVTVRDRTVTGTDDYGNDTYGWVKRNAAAWWEPRSSGEQTDAREQVTSGYWLFLEPGDPLTAASQVHFGADAEDDSPGWYEVDGEPGEQPGGFVLDGFVRTAVTKVTG